MARVVRFDAPFGAEILDIDLSNGIGDDDLALVRKTLAEQSVVVFRRQQLSYAAMTEFTRRLGPPRIPLKSKYAVPGFDGLHILSNIKENGELIGVSDAGYYWHSDGAYMQQPDSFTLLYAIEVPHDEQGNPLGSTRFASTRLAYQGLPQAMKSRLDGLNAEFSVQLQYDVKAKAGQLERGTLASDERSAAPDQIHPAIRVHPQAGDKCIFVSEIHTTRILGVSPEESEEIRGFLRQHIVQPAYRYDHRWQVGDLLVWDNPSTQHVSTHDYHLPQRRLMLRTSCTGSKPFGIHHA